LELPRPRIVDQTALGVIGVMMEVLPALMGLEDFVTTMARHHGQTVSKAIGIAMVARPARTDSVAFVIAMAHHHGQTVLGAGGTVMAQIVVLMVLVASDVIKAPNDRFERDAAKRRAPQAKR
jgi:hypothetical protein